MKINIIANHVRSQRNEPLTIEMLQAELRETKSLKAVIISQKIAKQHHISALKAMINYKERRKQ